MVQELSGKRQHRTLIVVLGVNAAAIIALTAGVVMNLTSRPARGPDPYPGSYPVAPAVQAAAPVVWTPAGPAAGPLQPYPGKATKSSGWVVDRAAGLAYARLSAPWRPMTGVGSHTAGIEDTVQKPAFQWLAGAYSAPLDSVLAARATGPQHLRAAAELDAGQWAKGLFVSLAPLAGEPLKISGHAAWLAGFRAHGGSVDRTLVIVAVDTGRRVPGIFEVSVAKPAAKLLPDVTALLKSLRVVR